jgi:tripartite-type tricarboxylate transporter receptor subunit TctC
MFKKFLIAILIMISFQAISLQYLHGKEYPTKPIEIFVPYGAGGSLDLGARLIAEIAKKYLGQPLIVLNKVGAGGTVAATEVFNSKPDGYKILYFANNFFVTTIKTQKIPFDPNYFVPLANFTEERMGLIVKGDSPWRTFSQLLDYGRQNPGKLKWGHTGRGIGQHLSQLLIFKKAGVETIDIPYKSSPEQLAAVLGGHLDATAMLYVTAKDHVRAGTVRFLVTYSNRRYSDTPDVPCATELGFPDLIITHQGFHIHKDTPEDIKQTLFDAFKKTFEDPEFKKGVVNIGVEPVFGGTEFMRNSMKKAEEVGVPILKELGLYDKSWDNR